MSGDSENLKVIRLGSPRPDPAALRASFSAALLALAAFPVLSYFLALVAVLPLGDQIVASGINLSPAAEIDAAWIEKASGLLLAIKQGSYVLKAVTAFLVLSLALALFRRADKPLAIALFGGAYLLLVPGSASGWSPFLAWVRRAPRPPVSPSTPGSPGRLRAPPPESRWLKSPPS